jgi:hypothetical protein
MSAPPGCPVAGIDDDQLSPEMQTHSYEQCVGERLSCSHRHSELVSGSVAQRDQSVPGVRQMLKRSS